MNSKTNNDNLNLPLEYILINNELWEIDYNEGHALSKSSNPTESYHSYKIIVNISNRF